MVTEFLISYFGNEGKENPFTVVVVDEQHNIHYEDIWVNRRTSEEAHCPPVWLDPNLYNEEDEQEDYIESRKVSVYLLLFI